MWVILLLLLPRDVLDNIILLVILLLLCDPITLHLQAQQCPDPLDGAATEMKVSLAPHASFDQKQFALTWPASEFQQCFSATMAGDIRNESWYLGLCSWWSGIIKLHIWDTWHRSNKTQTSLSQSVDSRRAGLCYGYIWSKQSEYTLREHYWI